MGLISNLKYLQADQLYAAAIAGKLKEVPASFLSELSLRRSASRAFPKYCASDRGVLTKSTVAHAAAENGHFAQLPLNVQAICLGWRDRDYLTVLGLAAKAGHIGTIPPHYLNGELLRTQEGDAGENAFHHLVKTKTLGQLQQSLLDPVGLATSDKDGNIPIIDAFLSKQSEALPEYCWSTALPEIRFNGYLWGNNELPAKTLVDVVIRDTGSTLIHLAAETGRLGELPVSVLTEERLLRQNSDGLSPLYLACDMATTTSLWRQIPVALLAKQTDAAGHIHLPYKGTLDCTRLLDVEALDRIRMHKGGKTEVDPFDL